MKQDFLHYMQETFDFTQSEMTEFSCALSTPLKKSLRVNTNKISIEDFKKLAEKNNFTLTPTSLGKNTFYIDRDDTTLPLGHTLEHINGYFYVQELAASSSPYYMSGDKIDRGEYTILDMSASPGGKTTQLAEYYPNALIVANEIDKMRMKQLFENLDRMSAKNVLVTNYDGRFLKNFGEVFDKVLLDAPCSGEGTAYKTEDALRYWNLKNIKRVAKLQYQLLESAITSTKEGGEIVYSTCTLNKLENEEVIEKIIEKYGDFIEIVPLKKENTLQTHIRNWPHIDKTGGFFITKLRKKKSLGERESPALVRQGFEKLSANDERLVQDFLDKTFGLSLSGKYYTYRNEVYYLEKNIDFFWDVAFLFKTGIKIGTLENGAFEPNFTLGISFGIFKKNTIEVSKDELHSFLKGEEKDIKKDDGYYQIVYENEIAGIIKVKNASGKILLDNKSLRK